MEAFRAYPPEYNSPIPNECPDGTIVLDESARLERWGSCWQRYYTLSVEYFMSQQSRRIMVSCRKYIVFSRRAPLEKKQFLNQKKKKLTRRNFILFLLIFMNRSH